MGPTHAPIPHIEFVETTETVLGSMGLRLHDEQFGMTHEGKRFFGVADVQGLDGTSDGHGFAIAWRGSVDKSFSEALAFGGHVFCCDNLAFHGEHVLTLKNTTTAADRMYEAIEEAVVYLREDAARMEERFAQYKAIEVSVEAADAAIMQMLRRQVVGSQRLTKVVQEWDMPSHEEFYEPTVWRLYNACTEALKPGTNANSRIPTMTKGNMALHAICDELAGFAIA